jgi:hypothetical protein
MESKKIYTITIRNQQRHFLAVSKFHAIELAMLLDEYVYKRDEYKIKREKK